MKTRKLFSKLFLFVLVLVTAFTVAACGDNTETPTGPSGEKTVTSVTLNTTTATITVGEELTYSNFKITVNYSDETTQEVTLTESMISGDDLALLGTVGTHALTVTVMGKTATLTVTVNPRTMEGVAMEGVTKTYDGQAAVPTVTGLPLNTQVTYKYYKGDAVDASQEVAAAVDAGTYFVVATVSGAGYAPVEKTATITINPAVLDIESLVWSNTKYPYTGDEITLAATVTGLPQGVTVEKFVDSDEEVAKATEAGNYTATAVFTITNPNYVANTTPCLVKWKIYAPIYTHSWYGLKAGQFSTVTFVKGATENDITMTIGAENIVGTVEYNEDEAVVTLPAASGYTVTVTDDVLIVEKDDETAYFLATNSVFANFAGTYSTIVDEFAIAIDQTNNAITFTRTPKGGTAANKELTLDVADDTVRLTVDGTDMALTYDADMQRVKLDGYANPADFNQVDSDGVYLLTKTEADAFVNSMSAGTYTDYQAKNVLTVADDKSVTFNGNAVQPYGVFVDYFGTKEARFYISITTNKREARFVAYEGFYSLEVSYSAAMFVPAEYKNYFGTYYTKNTEGTALNTSEKVTFMEHEGYYRIYIGSTDYVATAGEIAFSLTGTTLTATLTKTDSTAVTATFTNGTSVTVGTTEYVKAKTLFSTSSYTYFYNATNGKYIKDSGNGKVSIYGTEYLYKSLEYTATGLKITVDVGGTDKIIEYKNDARYVIYDGIVHVSDSIGSVSNGKANDTYYNGENTIKVSASGEYTLTQDGTSTKLTEVVFSIVDDGNNNGRTIIQAAGKLNGVDCVIKHYSLATVLVDGVAYAHSNYKDIMGSEFKPSADSQDVFTYGTNGKMTFRGTEIFLNGTGTYTNFNFTDNYFYSIDINTTRVQFHDQINWNIKYYFAAYFDFNGVYVSADNTKVFYFDDTMVAYDNTTTTSFKVNTTATGAEMTLSSKTAVFTKVAGGANTVTYDGVTYTRRTGFDIANYYGEYTAFDGSANGASVVFTAATISNRKAEVKKLIMYDGQIVPVIYVNYTTYYLIPNTDSATSAQLPILAVLDRFASFPKSTTFDGKALTIQIKAVPKTSGTGYVPSVSVVYDGSESALNYQSGTYSTVIDDVKYILDENDDATTKEQLPVLVFEAWWDDFDGSYTYNGKTTKVEIVVDASGTTPVPALKFTYEDEVVDVTITNVQGADGVKRIEFTTDDSKNYVGIMNPNAQPVVAVYSEAEFDFFFAADNTTTVDNKDLVLVANSASSGVTFDLESSSYDGAALTSVLYLPADGVLIFATADGTYAYDFVADDFWTDVIAADDAPLIGLNYSYGWVYGHPLSSTTITSELSAFDKATGKATLIVRMGYRSPEVTSITKVSDGIYRVVGKTYNSDSVDVTVYLLLNETKKLVTGEEYTFPGTHTVDDKQLVIAKSGTSYTAAYDGGAAVAITPDFSARKFMMKTAEKTYLVSWTYTTDFTFTLTEVTAEALAFEGYGYAYFNGISGYPYELTVAFKGLNASGKAEYNVSYEMGSADGTVTGTLSDNGQYIIATINRNSVWIFKNATNDYDTEFIMLTSCNARNLVGKYTVDTSEIVIGIGVESSYDYDDEFDGFETPKFIITVDGVAATGVTAWSTSASSIEFTAGGKTYTATYASGTVTIAEKVA